jgi:hypothetical protein
MMIIVNVKALFPHETVLESEVTIAKIADAAVTIVNDPYPVLETDHPMMATAHEISLALDPDLETSETSPFLLPAVETIDQDPDPYPGPEVTTMTFITTEDLKTCSTADRDPKKDLKFVVTWT